MKLISVLTALVATSSTAFAGSATLYSMIPEDLTFEYELESGEPYKDNLARGVSGPGYRDVSVKNKGAAEVTVKNGAGTLITGKVTDGNAYLVYTQGGKTAIAMVGKTSKDWTPYPGVVVVNISGDPLTLDLFEQGGSAGAKNVKIANAFDVKQAQQISASQSSFTAIIHAPDGSTVKSTAAMGSYFILHKDRSGAYAISALGYIEPPSDNKTPAAKTPPTKAPGKGKKG
jgi:hypothetical protein